MIAADEPGRRGAWPSIRGFTHFTGRARRPFNSSRRQGVSLGRLLLAWLLLALPLPAWAGATTGVGYLAIQIPDPVNGGRMPGLLFYPSDQAAGATSMGPYRLDATEGARARPGPRPLVLISHGHGGSDVGHHDLAEFLASRGFIVATLTHPKDNYRDSSGAQEPEVLVGRPIEVSATIDYLLRDPRWSALIDPNRIGVAGFSAGGYTALMLVGAEPRFARILDYCRAHPGDTGVCDGVHRLEAENANNGQTLRQSARHLQDNLHRWGNPDDPRIKAAFAMAPFSVPFGRQGLAHINRPVFLYYAQNDQVLWPQYNARWIAPRIRTLAGLRMIPIAGHYVFLSPCTPELAEQAPELCNDGPGVDRLAIHRQINANALAFFRRTLGWPARRVSEVDQGSPGHRSQAMNNVQGSA